MELFAGKYYSQKFQFLTVQLKDLQERVMIILTMGFQFLTVQLKGNANYE